MAPSPVAGEGETFVAGRSATKARELVLKAEAAGLAGSVRTTSHGYILPTEAYETELPSEEDPAPADTDSDNDDVPAHKGEQAPEGEGTEGDGTGDNLFDPADHKIEEVQAYLADADDAERERVLASERDGKARVTILNDGETK